MQSFGTTRPPGAGRPWTSGTDPIDRAVETPCFLVAGWPLFDDEIGEAASVIGCRPAALRKTPASPLSVWRRFGGVLPKIERTLSAHLVASLAWSRMYSLVDVIDPAAWIARDGTAPFVYGAKHLLDSSNSVRKGGVRTACFIGDDASDAEKIERRFVAQFIHDHCRPDGADYRLKKLHGYECLATADNGPRDAKLPDYYECAGQCDCADGFGPDGNRYAPTTWRKLLHRAERFLSDWELVRIVVSPDWSGVDIRPGDLNGWPLWAP